MEVVCQRCVGLDVYKELIVARVPLVDGGKVSREAPDWREYNEECCIIIEMADGFGLPADGNASNQGFDCFEWAIPITYRDFNTNKLSSWP